LPCQAGNEISWQKFQGISRNFAKFRLFRETNFREISRNKHKNFAKYERNSFAKFREISFREISSTTLLGTLAAENRTKADAGLCQGTSLIYPFIEY
jgi:hypothetical protein